MTPHRAGITRNGPSAPCRRGRRQVPGPRRRRGSDAL